MIILKCPWILCKFNSTPLASGNNSGICMCDTEVYFRIVDSETEYMECMNYKRKRR